MVMTFVETGLTAIIDADKNILAVRIHAEVVNSVSFGTEELVGGIT